MATETTSTLVNLLYEMQGVAQRNYPRRAVLLSELEGKRRGDGEKVYTDRGRITRSSPAGRRRFSGKWVRIPIELSPVQGTGTVSETGTVNTPHVENLNEAHITMARVVHPISISMDAAFASRANFANSGDLADVADAVRLRLKNAEPAMARTVNEMLHQNGDALLAACTSGATSTTVTVGTSANFYQLYPGRIVDILTRSNGTPVTNGAGRTIQTANAAAGTFVVDVSITTSTNEGVYIEGSYGTAIQGLGQIVATTGTFENIDKAVVQGWQGVDGRSGDTTVSDLSMSILDNAEYQVGNNGDGPDFYIGDPKVIDRYTQTIQPQSIYAGDKGTLETGWTGVSYRGKVLVGDRDSKLNRLIGVDMDAYQLYSYADGPGWVSDLSLDGTPAFMRFSRALPAELWFADFVQLGAHRTNTTTVLDNLARA